MAVKNAFELLIKILNTMAAKLMKDLSYFYAVIISFLSPTLGGYQNPPSLFTFEAYLWVIVMSVTQKIPHLRA
jgi:hypothetical protein